MSDSTRHPEDSTPPVPDWPGRQEALEWKEWMDYFLSHTCIQKLEHEREEIKTFGVRRYHIGFTKVWSLLSSASYLKPHGRVRPVAGPAIVDVALASMGDWLLDKIQKNDARSLESLAEVLRARHKGPKRQNTLKATILDCLQKYIWDAGGPRWKFSHAASNTRHLFFSIDRVYDHPDLIISKEEAECKLKKWWCDRGAPDHLFPTHLPTKKELLLATALKLEVPAPPLKKQFSVACKELGLSKLPAGKKGG